MNLQFDMLGQRTFSDHGSWHQWLHECLSNKEPGNNSLVVYDMFAGCGGLALGLEAIVPLDRRLLMN